MECDKARAAGQMDWQQDNGKVEHWTSTAYAATTAWCAKSTGLASAR
ncbi:hypothetical protein [Azospirillum himalayense]|uniref:Uncharacterized protein n=1 Tax=Azospirillum himalayense TaxID=654847 RepID=A0ABW0G9S8_9PROT